MYLSPKLRFQYKGLFQSIISTRKKLKRTSNASFQQKKINLKGKPINCILLLLLTKSPPPQIFDPLITQKAPLVHFTTNLLAETTSSLKAIWTPKHCNFEIG